MWNSSIVSGRYKTGGGGVAEPADAMATYSAMKPSILS
jgi:hypothetical protein